MGFYINPRNGEKETWLEEFSQPFEYVGGNRRVLYSYETPNYATQPANTHWVCLVYNGDFTAAGIAFDREEFDAFARPDERFKVWFAILDSDLIEVCPSVAKALA